MRYVMQLLIIIAFAFAGEVLHHLLPLPFPANIYGIILLYLALHLKMVKVKQIKEVSTTLIIAMPVMFIPPAVGLMNTWGDIRDSWPQYLLITILTTFIVMACAGWATQLVIRYKNKHKN
jgi:holin-like protein